jgi:hypothetical protein
MALSVPTRSLVGEHSDAMVGWFLRFKDDVAPSPVNNPVPKFPAENSDKVIAA